jgi:WD40 repeat protein
LAGRAVARWDAESGRLRYYRLLPGRPRDQFWLSPDGRLLAVAEDKSLAVFDLENGTLKRRLPVTAACVAFHPEGKALATSEFDKDCLVRLWDLTTGEDRLVAEMPHFINDLVFRPDGKRLFGAAKVESLHCWDIVEGKRVWKNGGGASHLAISPDGRTLCLGTYQGDRPYIMDADTGRLIGGGSRFSKRGFGPLAFAPDGRTVFVTDFKDVLLCDPDNGEARRRLAGAGSCFTVAPDGKTLVSLAGSLLRRWDVETGKPLYPDTAADGPSDAVRGVSFTPDGLGLVSAGADGLVRLWELATQRPRRVASGAYTNMGSTYTWTPDGWRTVYSPPVLALTPDGRHVLSANAEGRLRLTDLRTKEEVRRFDVRVGDFTALVGTARFSADGRTLWALTYHWPEGTGSIDLTGTKETMIAWNVASGRRLSSHAVTCGNLWDNVIAPDGRSVALAEGTVRDVASGELRPQASPWLLSYPCAFSADGRLLAAVADRENWNAVAVHEVLTGRPIVRMEAAVSWSSRFAFSPDGRLLVAVGRDALHVWEVSSGRRLLHLPAEGRLPAWSPGSFGTSLAVSTDGRSAATGHEDGTVLLWDLAPAWKRLGDRPAAPPTAEQLGACWADLLKDDPHTAYAAMDRLAAVPEQSLPLFRKHLWPVTIDSQWLKERLAALDSPDYAAREQASRDLEGVVEVVDPRLRRELGRSPSAEVLARLRRILEAPRPLIPPAETVRRLRAVAVLELLATTEARALLQELAKGEPAARLTGAANDALARLAVSRAP